MKKKIFFMLLMCTLAFMLIVPVTLAEDTEAPGSLHTYAPYSFWSSMDKFLDDPAMDAAFEAIAEAAADAGKECYDADALRDLMGETFAADFSALAVSKRRTFTYYDEDGSIEAICKYRYKGTETIELNGEPVVLHKYKCAFCIPRPTANFKRSRRSPYKYVTVTPVHRDEGSDMLHAHIRYGNTSFDDLMTNPEYGMWRPTIALYGDTTAETFAEDVIADASEFASRVPECPVEPTD